MLTVCISECVIQQVKVNNVELLLFQGSVETAKLKRTIGRGSLNGRCVGYPPGASLLMKRNCRKSQTQEHYYMQNV